MGDAVLLVFSYKKSGDSVAAQEVERKLKDRAGFTCPWSQPTFVPVKSSVSLSVWARV